MTTDTLHRRAFMHNGSLLLLSGGVGSLLAEPALSQQNRGQVRLGLVTDLHYADKPTAGTRHYRDTLSKLEVASQQFHRDRTEVVVELGDFIDAADSVKTEQKYLKRINKDFAKIPGDKHYVLGNHCVYTLTKKEFLDTVERKKSYYSFDKAGFHFVILDACFRHDGKPYGRKNFNWTDPNIPARQVKWLEQDLKTARGKTVVFIHQRLDVGSPYGVKNAKQIRKVLKDSGKVLAVFQGHSHDNEHRVLDGIHYCVVRAMIEGKGVKNNGFCTMDMFSNGTIRITGHQQQKPYKWSV